MKDVYQEAFELGENLVLVHDITYPIVRNCFYSKGEVKNSKLFSEVIIGMSSRSLKMLEVGGSTVLIKKLERDVPNYKKKVKEEHYKGLERHVEEPIKINYIHFEDFLRNHGNVEDRKLKTFIRNLEKSYAASQEKKIDSTSH
jgi:hypothetical protein